MATVKIESDELYPYFFISKYDGTEVTVTTQTLRRWARVTKQWQDVQDEMAALTNPSHGITK